MSKLSLIALEAIVNAAFCDNAKETIKYRKQNGWVAIRKDWRDGHLHVKSSDIHHGIKLRLGQQITTGFALNQLRRLVKSGYLTEQKLENGSVSFRLVDPVVEDHIKQKTYHHLVSMGLN